MFTYAHRYIVVIIANVMANIASGTPQLLVFTPYHNLDEDMWNDVGSEIIHLSS
jgi:hypothetical protein